MDNVFTKWDVNRNYSKGEVVYFGGKLYLSNTDDNKGILPIRRQTLENAFNSIKNDELVDRLINEYGCKENLVLSEVITYNNIDMVFESDEILPILFEYENLFSWRLI